MIFFRKRRGAFRHSQAGYLGQQVQHFLGKAIGHVFLVLVGRHVSKRKSNDPDPCFKGRGPLR